MAEYISKDEIIDAHYNACKKDPSKCFEVWSLQIMLDLPTIDIVRCSECEHRNNDGFCPYEKACPPDHWFCANGEKRYPPIIADEITELNDENNKLLEENKELKDKLWEINCISRLSVLEELHKEEMK